MPVLMKKRPISKEIKIIVEGENHRLFIVPGDKTSGVVRFLKKFKEFEIVDKGITRKEAFKDLHEKNSEPGSILKGERYTAGITQAELAKKLGVTQADVSKMESGRRPIGKTMARRLEKIFKTNYRLFL